jgi:hypothetical protein
MSIDEARRDAARATRARALGIPEWQLQMTEAVGTAVIDDLIADSRRTGFTTTAPSPEPVRGNGWVEARWTFCAKRACVCAAK